MLPEYQRFSSVSIQWFSALSKASSLSSGVLQSTCIVRFSAVFYESDFMSSCPFQTNTSDVHHCDER